MSCSAVTHELCEWEAWTDSVAQPCLLSDVTANLSIFVLPFITV